MADVEQAFDFVMALEGGGELHTVPGDPGGTTKWGFSQRAYPDLDIANLDREMALSLFVRDFWAPIKGGRIESQEIATEIVEMAFNTTAPGSSSGPAVRCAQLATNDVFRRSGYPDDMLLAVDGHFGPATLAGLNAVADLGPLGEMAWDGRFNIRQLRYYRGLRPDLVDRFFVGWSRRVA